MLFDSRVLQSVAGPRRVGDSKDEQKRREELIKRVELLVGTDRTLAEMAIVGQVPVRRLAGFTGLPAGTICRRLRSITKRIQEPVVAALLERRCPLPPDIRQLGVEYFLQGMGERELSEKHRMTRGQVRRAIQYVRGWHRGIRSSQ